ncbi:hypothetical protein KTC28_20755 (plasmid) [Polymorphobacter megasporae]|nr:hypothetical protein [Polymorphobacter megasporae]UAJ12962.1 hypothetical protein KTC28_20755 [Polymorphobacter megasporae]
MADIIVINDPAGPHRLEQVGPAYNALAVRDKIMKDIKEPLTDFDSLAVATKRTATGV